MLEERLPVRVVLTRDNDGELPLEARAALANQYKGDLFVSLHLNSAHGSSANGAETYFLSLEATDEAAAMAAAAENVGSQDGDPLFDLQLLLWDLAQSQHLAHSQTLAKLIQEELNLALDMRNRGVKQAPFRVLMGVAMPAVLVEFGFLSNPSEETKLRDPQYRLSLAEALVDAISRYRAGVSSVPGGQEEAMTRQQTAIAVVAGLVVALILAWLFLSPGREDEGPVTEVDREEVDAVAGEALTLRLYFPATSGRLAVEEREVPSVSGADLLRAAAAEVLAGPVGSNLFRPFPEGTEAGSVFVSDAGIAYVDLVSTRPRPPASGSLDEMLSVYSLVNTLQANLPEVAGVVLLWNGQQRPSFAGHLDTGRPLTTNEALVEG